MKAEYIEITCEQCENPIGYAIDPRHIPKVICHSCVEWKEDFHRKGFRNAHDRSN